MPAPSSDPIATALDALLAATPEPPARDTDPGDVVNLAHSMLDARAPLFAALAALDVTERQVPPSCADRYSTLLERNARWSACLTQARHVLAQRLGHARRLRYAP